MKLTAFLSTLLLVCTLTFAADGQPTVRRLADGAAADVVAGDGAMYLFVRYDAGQIVEMIVANTAPASVEPQNGRLTVTFRTPAGGTLSFGGNRGANLIRMSPEGRVRQTQKRLPAFADDPVAGFEQAIKDGKTDLAAYLAGREDTAALVEFFTAPEPPPAEPRQPASRPARPERAERVPLEPTADLADALRGGGVNLQRVRNILDKKPDLKATNARGEPFVYQAVRTGDVDVIFTIIQAGAEPNAKTTSGETPMYIAVRNNNTGVARVLLENGADPNLPNGNGWTPLGMAAFNSQFQMTRLLLSFKADPNLMSRDKRPVDWAKMQPRNGDVVKAISEAAGAKTDK